VEMADGYQVDFNGRQALRVSVSPLMYPSDVAECLQVLEEAHMKTADALLLSPGDFEEETANGNVVEIYLLEKEEGGDSG
jgi:hypothetical protein